MEAGNARPLARRYAWGVAAVALPLLLLIGGLAVTQFRSERAARIDLVARDLSDLQLALDALLKPADDHVESLRRSAEDHLSGRLATPVSPFRAALRVVGRIGEGDAGGALSLQDTAGSPAAPLAGNLHGRPDLLATRGGNPSELDMALGLFEPMRTAHLANAHLRWSYYFSGKGDFLVEYPFASERAFMQSTQTRTFEAYLSTMFGYDIFRLATPALNPERRGYWTPIYLDAGGAGWMVSHASPVYVGDTFMGMVGTDILLNFLETVLQQRYRPPGRVWLVDEHGRILAGSAGGVPRQEDPPTLAAALPAALTGVRPERLRNTSARPRPVNGWETMALPLDRAPWLLVFVAPESEITGLVIAGLWPYAFLLGGVVATLAAAQHELRRNFVAPSIALAARVEAQTGGAEDIGPPPRVPRFWHPWFVLVDQAFQSGRRNLAHAREEQALKSAVLEAAFDSIITTDDQGRVLELNAGAEATFGFSRDQALGRRIGDLIVPPHLRARHVEGMARYLATGERRVLGRRIEIEGMRGDGTIFPVELAIAEVRLADRRLFTAYLRDISDRRLAARALQESESRYRTVVEDQTELISRYDSEFRLSFANAAHGRFFGFEPEAAAARDLFDFVPAERRELVRRELLALTPGDPIRIGVAQLPAHDGAPRWFAWTTRALFDEQGDRTGYLSVGRDITDARRAEQALRESEARFFAAAESLPDGFMILDPDDRIVFYNSRHRELLPPALQAVLRVGIRFTDFVREGLAQGPVYHPEMGRDYAERRLASRKEPLTDREHKHADGRWVRIREGRMPDGGRVLLTVDVTARREAVEALRQSQARYRAVVEGQTEFILRLGPDGVLTFVNDAYCRYRGRSREALLAGFDDIAHYRPEQQRQIRAAWERLTPANPTVTFEFDARNGNYRCEERIDTGIFDEEGCLVEIQSVGRDITERKQAEAEIRRQREAAHQREKLASFGSLLAGVAHELNNPLSVVVGRAIMLEEEAADPVVRLSLSRLRAAAERCARIVRTFLALARDEPRKAASPVDVNAVLDGVLDLAYGLRSTGVEVVCEVAGTVPPAMADADQLGQVLLNLVVNAQQALEGVPPPRRLWLRTSAGPGVVAVEVADNGPGVPLEIRDRIFEPFFTTKPVGAGTGLGLSVCHGIIAAYAGTLDIGDRPGGGARFVLTLPAAAVTSVGIAAESPAPDAAQATGGDVLIVDDEPEVVAMLEEVLARDGHRVMNAPDGLAARALLRDHSFDAVLCDLRMPHLDGLGLLRELEASRPSLAQRLLLMTGDGLRAAVTMSDRRRLLEKPLDPDEVRHRVRMVIEGNSENT